MAGDVKVSNNSAALSTASGGTTDFTEADFGTPLACRIVITFDEVDDTVAALQSKVSIGFSDFTNDFCITHQDEDASAKVDCDTRKSNTRSYVVLDAAGAVLFSGTASAITDGVRLTHTAGEAPASAFFASVTMWGGADPAVDLRSTGIASAQNGTATITHAGLTDGNEKLIFFIGVDIAGENTSSTGINISYGVCHISGNDAGGYTFTQRCMGWASDHNNTVGSPFSILSTDRVLDMITETGGQDWGLEVTAFSNSGGTITVTTRDSGAGAGMEVYSFIVDLDDRKAKVGSVDGPTSGATWDPTVSLTFTPQWVDLMLTDLTNENTISTDAEAGVMGISSNTGAGGETCHSWYNEDAAATTKTRNLFRSRAIDLRDHDVSTVLQDHSHSAFDSTGWTYTINAENETVAKKWAFATVEEATVVVPTGIGAPTLEPFIIAAVGEQPHEAVGALEMGTMTMAAFGTMQPAGVGAPTLEAMALVSSGVEKFLATGVPTLEALSLVAAGVEKFLATGTPTMESLALAAVGEQPHEATGAPSLADFVLAAIGEQPHTAVGAPDLEIMELIAVGEQPGTGVGAPDLEIMDLTAVGSAGAPPEGTGAPTLESFLLAAVGVGPAAAGSLWPPMRRRRRPGR